MKNLLFGLLLTITTTSWAGTTDSLPVFSLQQLDSRNGLSNSCVNYIYQDSDDLLWIGTWDGLNVYNGTGFHVFNFSRSADGNIGSGVIKKITEDEQGRIWVITTQGLSQYNKKTGKFTNYFYSQVDFKKGAEVPLMAMDAGRVYFFEKRGPQTLVVHVYNDATGTFEKTGELPGEGADKVVFDSQHRLWIYRNTGVLSFVEFSKGRPVRHRNFPAGQHVNNLFFSGRQLFYTTAANQLYEINTLLPEQRLVASLPYPIQDLVKYGSQYLVASHTKGYQAFNEQFKPVPLQVRQGEELHDMQIKCMVAGSEQMLWMATDGNGLIKLAPYQRHFNLVSQKDKIFNTAVRSFCETDGALWVGTKGNGIVTLPYAPDGHLLHQQAQSFKADVLGNNAVYTIVKSKASNALYIGSDGLGITLYDRATKQFIKWKDIKGTDKCGLVEYVYAIHEDEDGSLWLGTNGYGLMHVKLGRDAAGQWSVTSFKRYSFDGTDKGPSGDAIFAIVAGSNDQLWMACRDGGGLNVFNKRTGTFRSYKAFTYNGSISHNDVLSLFRDRQGTLWIGTSYGLNWVKEDEMGAKQPVFGKLTVADGLPNNTVHAITADTDGDIWISTNNGLARVNQQARTIVRFKETDGLQSNEFSDGSVYRNATGNLFFGGVYGFNYFRPEDIHYNNAQPKLLLSALKLGSRIPEDNNLQVLEAGAKGENPFYVLPRSENFLALSIKAVSYSKADKCMYAYYLEGYDKQWNTLGVGGDIVYANLSPGEYTLKLKWSDGEGGWLKETTAFQLRVKQYIWLTWPAFAIYALILGSMVYALTRYRRNKLEMKHKLDMEHMMRRKEEELHQEKLNFFTNIAHELQTPLTLISAASERALGEGAKVAKPAANGQYFLSLIHSQSARLTYLLQQLMEFQKSGAGLVENQYVPLHVSAFLSNIFELFHPISEHKSLTLTTDIAPDVHASMDKDKLEKIIFNLLSNAFKHTPNGEEISLSLRQEPGGEALIIEVANSGCTLSGAEVEKLFTRFFVGDAARVHKANTGIGLAFTQQLVGLLKGRIEATCDKDWIRFTVTLPVTAITEAQEVASTSKAELPSSLIRTIITGEDDAGQQPSLSEQNKKALIESLHSDKKTVLVVEDEMSIRHLLREVLSERYIVFEAATGSDAIWFMMKKLPHLIISDVMMPDMDGLTLCKKVKNTPSTCHIPFLLLSARSTPDQKHEGYECGADAYVAKPFNTAHLLLRVRKLLDYQQQLHTLFSADAPATVNAEEIPNGTDKDFIVKVVEIIEKNISEQELNAALIEEQLSMSKMQLYRKMKSLTNMTPGEFIRQHRVRKAASLLVQTDLTVSEIFYQTGFNNQSYFFREFKKQYGCSPNEYRVQQRLNMENE
jgi:signal transduction histidine kinase/ligand-binding sensor domain-containing protein/DNA-binding response OmpR family regulator